MLQISENRGSEKVFVEKMLINWITVNGLPTGRSRFLIALLYVTLIMIHFNKSELSFLS